MRFICLLGRLFLYLFLPSFFFFIYLFGWLVFCVYVSAPPHHRAHQAAQQHLSGENQFNAKYAPGCCANSPPACACLCVSAAVAAAVADAVASAVVTLAFMAVVITCSSFLQPFIRLIPFESPFLPPSF